MYEENANCMKTFVSFRIASESDFDPDIITARLGINPDIIGKKGEYWKTLASINKVLLWPRSIWSINTEEAINSTNLERHIAFILDFLEPKAQELLAIIEEYNLLYDFFAYWESRT